MTRSEKIIEFQGELLDLLTKYDNTKDYKKAHIQKLTLTCEVDEPIIITMEEVLTVDGDPAIYYKNIGEEQVEDLVPEFLKK